MFVDVVPIRIYNKPLPNDDRLLQSTLNEVFHTNSDANGYAGFCNIFDDLGRTNCSGYTSHR